jgi:hypothetical protein
MAFRSGFTKMALAAAILVGVVGTWRWTRTLDEDVASRPGRAPPLLANTPTTASTSAADALDRVKAATSTGANEALPAPDDESGAAPPRILPAHARPGARALSTEGERRVEKFLAGLRIASSDARDYETLGRSEPADPDWSPRLEALIQQTIERHAHEFGHLEISRPRCSKSLCMLTAAGTTRNPHLLAHADFQRLVGHMMQEPWFRASFFDASTTVAGDSTGNIYASYFIRK